MARESYEEKQLRRELARKGLDDLREQRLDKMRSSGVTESGARIIGWSDKSTPLTGFKDGLSGGNPRTPKAAWDEMFRSRFTGTNPLAAPAASTIPASTAPARSAFGDGLQANAPTIKPLPSLTTLANGGLNHAQKWMSPTDVAAQGQRDVAKYQAPGTVAMTRFDNTPGTRTPFIAGANGINVAPQIAAKVNPNDPTLNPDFKKRMAQFSWSSAFSPA